MTGSTALFEGVPAADVSGSPVEADSGIRGNAAQGAAPAVEAPNWNDDCEEAR